MPSRPMTRANIIDQCNNILGSTLSTTWTDTKLNQLFDDVITEVSGVVPYISRDIYQIESRTGTASSTGTSGTLVDATNAQFISTATDKGKVVYNTTDKTWAVIESITSTSIAVLSKDIFTSGEDYEIYNKACWSKKQINIANSDDYLWIIGAVYPVQPNIWEARQTNMRNVIVHSRDIIELDVDYVDDSADTDGDKDVYIYFARQHKVNPMTDLAGATTSAIGTGLTSMVVGSLASADVVYKDMLFTVALATGVSSRLTYRVTRDTTLTTKGTIYFTPGLEASLTAGAVVTFVGSTLIPELERIIVQLMTGQALMAQAVSKIDATAFGGPGVARSSYDIGSDIVRKARADLNKLVDVDLRATHIYSRG